MKHKFEVGDEVRMIKPQAGDSDVPVGTVGTITKLDGDDESLPVHVDWQGVQGFTVVSYDEIELAGSGVPARAAIPKFILQYDNERYELFVSEKMLRAGIATLSKDPVAGRTYTVFDIKRTRTVTLGVKITMK